MDAAAAPLREIMIITQWLLEWPGRSRGVGGAMGLGPPRFSERGTGQGGLLGLATQPAPTLCRKLSPSRRRHRRRRRPGTQQNPFVLWPLAIKQRLMGGRFCCSPPCTPPSPSSGGVSRGAYRGQRRKTPDSTQLRCLSSAGSLALLYFELFQFCSF